ncbi:MAG: hypothetical protein AAF628_06315 [Planctomycetota bacterium]
MHGAPGAERPAQGGPAAIAGAPWRDGALLAIGALAFYGLLLQRAFINEDARVFLNTLAIGQDPSAMHPLYGPVVAVLVRLLEPLGAPLYWRVELVSAAFTAIGVLLFHRAAASGMVPGRARSNLATALCALTPAVVFFATVIEIPGVLFGFAGCAWWLTARYLVRPGAWRAAVIGVATATMALLHATGHVFVMVVLGAAACLASPGVRAIHALPLLALHGIAFVTIKQFTLGGTEDAGAPLGHFFGFLADREQWHRVLHSAWLEWLWPFAPVSLLSAAALLRVGHRWLGAFAAACAGGYILFSFIVIPDLWERGTYVLPWVVLGATVAGRAVPIPVLGWALPVALGVSLHLVRDHDRPVSGAASAEDMVALVARDPRAFLILQVPAESDPLLLAAPEVPMIRSVQLIGQPYDDATLAAWFDQQIRHMTGRGTSVYLSQAAANELEVGRPGLMSHLRERYTFEAVREGTFETFRLAKHP